MRRHFPVLGGAVSAAVLVAGACGGGGHSNSAARQIAAGTQGSTSSSAASAAGTGAGSAGTTASSSRTSSAVAPGAGGSAAPATAAAGTASKAPASSTAVGAAPGHYTYDVSGSSSGGTPPTSGQVNGRATLTVDPAQGTDQHETLVSNDGSGNGTELVLRFQPTAVLLVDLKITGQFSKEFRPNPPVQAEPKPQTPGSTWTFDMTSTDNTTTAHGDYRISGTDKTSNGCQQVACGVVDGTLTIHTTFNGAPLTITLTTTRVDSPKYSLTVKEHDVTDVPGFFHSDTTSVIESVVPR